MRAALSILFMTTLLMLHRPARAQDVSWPSPEVEQMYNQGREYLTNGNFTQAIVVYEQAINLAPDKMILYRDLGKAYYLSGRYKEAEKTLDPLLKSDAADAQSYQIMGACLVAANDKKKAKGLLQKGIQRFPASGILYHDMGKLYEDGNEMVYALETWLDGIHNDPAYHVNYYEAARAYSTTDKVVWTIVYGEIFVNIEHETPRAAEMRTMIVDAYKKMYYTIQTGNVPQFGKGRTAGNAGNFEDAVRLVYLKMAPVVSDGITAESFTMLHTRFLMDWFSQYAEKYPFSLFSYQDDMLRNGYFDMYNQWLIGKAINPQEYEAWNKFHTGIMPQFMAWQAQHPLQPLATDFYNDRKVDDLFNKKKK